MESDWRSDLDNYFAKLDNNQGREQPLKTDKNTSDEQFFTSVALPALAEIKVELEKHGRQVTVGSSAHHVSIKVIYQDHIEFDYALYTRDLKVFPVQTSVESGSSFNAEGSLRHDLRDYTVRDITKAELIQRCLKEYKNSRLSLSNGTR